MRFTDNMESMIRFGLDNEARDRLAVEGVMTERPIIMTGESVRAILDGRKTQTRRVIKPTWLRCLDPDCADDMTEVMRQSPYQPGRLLWVKEAWGPSYVQRLPQDRARTIGGTWGCPAYPEETACVVYRADGDMPPAPDGRETARWCSPLFMPRWASRLTLRVLDVRAQRLQDTSPEDIEAEGVSPWDDYPGGAKCGVGELYARWRDGWDRINAKRGFPWASNPWAWAITFEVAT